MIDITKTPKLSSGRFEEIIIEIERHTHDISATVQNIPEAIGLMNVCEEISSEFAWKLIHSIVLLFQLAAPTVTIKYRASDRCNPVQDL